MSTLRALAAPRRSVPIALVCLAVIAAEANATRSLGALFVALTMAASFVLLVPALWRAASPVVYVAGCVGLVAVTGLIVPALLGIGPRYTTDPGGLGISVVLFAVGGWGLGRDIELEQSLEHTQLLALRAQLDPHFLYNTLNAIAEWCREDPRVAEEATLRLSSMLRHVLEGVRTAAWPIEREIALIHDLLELHRVRDEEAFSYRLDVADDLGATAIPPLLLLILAENAVKHGPRKGHRGEVTIVLRREGARLCFTAENPGPLARDHRPGEGLRALERRLRLGYEGQAELVLEPAGATRTRARLSFPATGANS